MVTSSCGGNKDIIKANLRGCCQRSVSTTFVMKESQILQMTGATMKACVLLSLLSEAVQNRLAVPLMRKGNFCSRLSMHLVVFFQKCMQAVEMMIHHHHLHHLEIHHSNLLKIYIRLRKIYNIHHLASATFQSHFIVL